MDASSLIVIVTPTMTLITLLTGIALPFIAGSRSGRSRARGSLASAHPRKRTGAGRRARPHKPRPAAPPPPDTCTFPVPASATAAPRPRRAAGSKRCRSSSRRPNGSTTPATAGTGSRPWSAPAASAATNSRPTPGATITARGIYAGLVCARHGRGHRHCVHVLAPGRRCHEPGGCGDDCQAGIRGWRCAKHGYTWEHCPHGEDRCRHGYPAGVIPVPGARSGSAGRLFFATRQAAEDHLYRGEGERAEQGVPHAPSVKELRRAMADAHPDRGGTAEQFIDARRRYQTALRPARR